jgi:hypothetical protein
MADAKEILQFGIEAARDGNREEARNLFTLLTKQDPNNIQAWLWLAGVSDTPTQRRNALDSMVSARAQATVGAGCSTQRASVQVRFLGARVPHLHQVRGGRVVQQRSSPTKKKN